jgi:hypothetical protein
MKAFTLINVVGAAGAAMVASSPLVSLAAIAAESAHVKDTLGITSAVMATGGITMAVTTVFIKCREED